MESDNQVRITRGWKLFILLPRMLLCKPPRGGKVAKNKLLDRFTKMHRDSGWSCRLPAQKRRKLLQTCVRDGVARGWTPWISESSGLRHCSRHALEGSPPVRPFELDKEGFLQNLRKARRGAAGGPSGMRTEHLRPLLDNIEDSNKFCEVSQAFAQIPDEILSAIRVGQLTSFGKPNGGVRGIVVGDVVRRLIAKTMSDQMMARFETATKHFQCALSTRAGVGRREWDGP